MGDLNSRIDKAFKRARREAFLVEFRGWRLVWLVVVCSFLFVGGPWAVALQNSPRHYEKTIQGHTHGSFLPASKYGAPSLSVTVILLDGRAINLRFPKTEPFRNNALVNIDVYEKKWPQGSVEYRFKSYADASKTGE